MRVFFYYNTILLIYIYTNIMYIIIITQMYFKALVVINSQIS